MRHTDRGYLGEFFIWLLGKPLYEEKHITNNSGGFVSMITQKKYWDLYITGYCDIVICTRYAPFFLHRWAQFLLLGIRYKRVKQL